MSTGRPIEGAATAPPAGEAAIWHDVECAGYYADLPLWRELASERGGPLLELGAGTGRVALDLAALGHDVGALDSDPELVEELRRRARERGLRVDARVADARSFELGRRFSLVLAPMQVVQLLGERGRHAMLAAARRHMPGGALLAAAVADPLDGLPAGEALAPLPDVREVGGWVYSSTPVALREAAAGIVIERFREAVSPTGELHRSAASVMLDRGAPEELTAAGGRLGFRLLSERWVPPTEAYVGSRVILLEAV